MNLLLRATYYDPFDNKTLCTVSQSYNPRLAAGGFYSKEIISRITEGRKIRVRIQFL